MAKQQVGEFTSIGPAARTQNARIQEPGVSPKNSLNPRHDLQHIQRPTPPHLGNNAPSLPGLGDADITRSLRRGMISVTRNFPHQIPNNATKPRIILRARTSHHAVLPQFGLAKVPALRVCGILALQNIAFTDCGAKTTPHTPRHEHRSRDHRTARSRR